MQLQNPSVSQHPPSGPLTKRKKIQFDESTLSSNTQPKAKRTKRGTKRTRPSSNKSETRLVKRSRNVPHVDPPIPITSASYSQYYHDFFFLQVNMFIANVAYNEEEDAIYFTAYVPTASTYFLGGENAGNKYRSIDYRISMEEYERDYVPAFSNGSILLIGDSVWADWFRTYRVVGDEWRTVGEISFQCF